MNHNWQRFAAVGFLFALGAGIIWFMMIAIEADGQLTANDGGWMAAAFLSLREVMSKIENVAMGIRAPAAPTDPMGES